MADPRWRIPEKRLPTVRQGGFATHDTEETLAETERRLRLALEKTKPPPVAAPAPQQALPGGPSNPVGPAPIDRFHKKGSRYATVSPIHLSGQDPVLDPAAYHTLNDGYAGCITLVNQLNAAGFTSPDDVVTMWVVGGRYSENLTLTNSRINVVGIGLPKIIGVTRFGPGCTSALLDGFELYNNPTDPEFPYAVAPLIIDEGEELIGEAQSTIRIKHCHIHAPLTAVYAQRWAYFEDCQIVADNNENFSWQALTVRFCSSFSQSRWTKFKDCFISGQNIAGLPLHKGPAIGIYAMNEDFTVWMTNEITEPSGAIFEDCEIDGYTENFGWNYEQSGGKAVGGLFINDTGDGAVHHIIHSHTNDGGADGIDSHSWFTSGVEVDANILVYCTDDNSLDVNVAIAKIRLRNIIHASPESGGVLVTAIATIAGNLPVVDARGLESATHKDYFYENPAATEAAILTACSVSVDSDTMIQGYVNK